MLLDSQFILEFTLTFYIFALINIIIIVKRAAFYWKTYFVDTVVRKMIN